MRNLPRPLLGVLAGVLLTGTARADSILDRPWDLMHDWLFGSSSSRKAHASYRLQNGGGSTPTYSPTGDDLPPMSGDEGFGFGKGQSDSNVGGPVIYTPSNPTIDDIVTTPDTPPVVNNTPAIENETRVTDKSKPGANKDNQIVRTDPSVVDVTPGNDVVDTGTTIGIVDDGGDSVPIDVLVEEVPGLETPPLFVPGDDIFTTSDVGGQGSGPDNPKFSQDLFDITPGQNDFSPPPPPPPPPPSVPEPASLLLAAAGALGVVARRRR